MLAGTCRSFPTKRPSDVLGIADEVVAADFNQAAAWVLRRGDDLTAVDMLKLQTRLIWGSGGKEDDDSGENNKVVSLQERANAFFGK